MVGVAEPVNDIKCATLREKPSAGQGHCKWASGRLNPAPVSVAGSWYHPLVPDFQVSRALEPGVLVPGLSGACRQGKARQITRHDRQLPCETPQDSRHSYIHHHCL